MWPSSNHRITFPGTRVVFRDIHYLSWFARFKRDHSLLNLANQIDLLCLSGDSDSNLDMFHEQLPLPVPCYDLVLVIEFAVVLREAVLRAPPTPLT
ncbi:MAG: hypothetical protein RLZZ26_228 [Candidatus Parcubacteria bacterium]